MVTYYSVLDWFGWAFFKSNYYLTSFLMHHGSSCYHCQIAEKSLCKFSATLPLELSTKINHMKGKKIRTTLKRQL